MLQNLVPFGLWGGSRLHDEHHKLGDRNYQKFFTFLDRATLVGELWSRNKSPELGFSSLGCRAKALLSISPSQTRTTPTEGVDEKQCFKISASW
jgi:hypothetical protein